ncbi:MAG: bifunctional nuclease family protein [Polyangiaceae bacterium]|nr:bifunctional nuclease family protein [Polyangiaceae bacterium]
MRSAVLLAIALLGGCGRDRPERLVGRFELAAARAFATLASHPRPAAGEPAAAAPAGEVPKGYVRMHVKAQTGPEHGQALLLCDAEEQWVIPIYVGGTEALSIGLRLARAKYPRPLTHDLLDATLHALAAGVDHVQVDALRDGTFIGSVALRTAAGLVTLDARPSDAIALAVGNERPIYVAEPVMREAALRVEDLDRDGPRRKPAEPTAL